MNPNINLAVQLSMGLALLVGMVLARRRCFWAHGICQTAVVLLNLIPIGWFMRPQLHTVVMPALPGGLHDRFYLLPTIHATLGTLAEVFGVYIILSAGLKILPQRLRFQNYKLWMRLELTLWWLVIALGLSTYFVWNVSSKVERPVRAPTATAAAPAPDKAARTVTVNIGNFAFQPSQIEIEAGTTVIWKNVTGRHNVTADDGSFESSIMAPGEEFQRTFDRAGRVPYYCKLHGGPGGQKMAASITVK